jgi:DNA-binding CsgD family transcriptional regulator
MISKGLFRKKQVHTAGLVALYGLGIGLVVTIMRWIDYKHAVHAWTLELYAGTIAVVFAVVGIWLGLHMKQRRKAPPETTIEVRQTSVDQTFKTETAEEAGLSRRELEVLQLMASGHSNQEIADKLFVSLNTVKTHTSNLYVKLEVKRRGQAVVKAKELGILE